jgi:hypothetical protein
MQQFLNDFAQAMTEINQVIGGHHNNNNQYKPGIDPYGEDQIVDLVMGKLSVMDPGKYKG